MSTIKDLVNLISTAQTVIQSETALRDLNMPKGKLAAENLHNYFCILVQKFKLYYAQLLHTVRRDLRGYKEPIKNVFSLISFDPNTFSELEIKDNPSFLDAFFKENKDIDIPTDANDIIDAITFQVIPTYFNFFIFQSRIRHYSHFMERIYNKDPELFFLFARSAFLSPEFISFIKTSAESLLENLIAQEHNLDGVISDIVTSIHENIKMCPVYIADLLKIAKTEEQQKKLIETCFYNVAKQDPRLFSLELWYNQQNAKERDIFNKIIDRFSSTQSNIFISEILNVTSNFDAFDDGEIYEMPNLFTEIHQTRLIDSFDSVFYNAFDAGTNSFKTTELKYDFNNYTISRTIKNESLKFKTELNPDRTSIGMDLEIQNVRDILKISPPIPQIEDENKFTLPFNVLDFLQSSLYHGNHKNTCMAIDCIEELKNSNNDIFNIQNTDSIDKSIDFFKSVYTSYDQTKILISKIQKIRTKQADVEFSVQPIFRHIQGLTFSVYIDSTIFTSIKPEFSTEEIIKHPALLFYAANKYLIPQLPEFIKSNQNHILFKEYILHMIYKSMSYQIFKKYRPDATHIDKVIYHLLSTNLSDYEEKFYKNEKNNDASNLYKSKATPEFNKCMREFNKILKNNHDPYQKHLELYYLLRYYSNFLVSNGFFIGGDEAPTFIIFFVLHSLPQHLFSNMVYINDFLFPFMIYESIFDICKKYKDKSFINSVYPQKISVSTNQIKIDDYPVFGMNERFYTIINLIFNNSFDASPHVNIIEYLNSFKVDFTFYVIGSDNSLAIPFLCEVLNTKEEIITANKNQYISNGKSIELFKDQLYANVKFQRVNTIDEIPQNVEPAYIFNLSYTQFLDDTNIKDSLKQSKEFAMKYHVPIIYNENEKSLKVTKNLIFKSKDLTYIDVNQTSYQEIFDSHIKEISNNLQLIMKQSILFGISDDTKPQPIPFIPEFFLK